MGRKRIDRPFEPDGMKFCVSCKELRLLSEFGSYKASYDGLSSRCKKCISERDRIHRQRNPGKQKERHKKYRATHDKPKNKPASNKKWMESKRRKTNFYQLLEAQGGVCAICKQPERSKNQWSEKVLARDHNHATGEFRGLLCMRCNVKLAVLEDQVFVSAASEYLALYNTQPQADASYGARSQCLWLQG